MFKFLFGPKQSSGDAIPSETRSHGSPVTDDVEFESLADVAEFARIRALVSVLQGYADDTEFKEERLLRVNGNATDIENVNRVLNNVDTFEGAVSVLDLLMDGNPNKHRKDISSAFKSRLRNLPVRIIPFNIATQLVREYPFNADYVADTIANHIHQTFEDDGEVEKAAMDTIEVILRMINAVVDNPHFLMTPASLNTCLMNALVLEKVMDPKLSMSQVDVMRKRGFNLFKAFLTHGRAIADVLSGVSGSQGKYFTYLRDRHAINTDCLNAETGMKNLRLSLKNSDKNVDSDLSYLSSAMFQLEESNDKENSKRESSTFVEDTPIKSFRRQGGYLNAAAVARAISESNLEGKPNGKAHSKKELRNSVVDTTTKPLKRQGVYIDM